VRRSGDVRAGGRPPGGGAGACGWVLAGLLLLGGLVPAEPVLAGRPGEVLKEKKEALGQVRRRLEAAGGPGAAARTREVSLLAELERMERTVAGKRGQLRRLDGRIVRLEAELAALQGERGRVAEDIVAQQGALGARLRALATLDARPAPPGWLGEGAEAARARALDDLARLTRADLAQLSLFGEAAERLTERQRAVKRVRAELVDARRAVDTERAAMLQEAERRRALLAEVRDDRATHERMVAELEDAGRRLEVLVRTLSRRAVRAVAVRPVEPGGPPSPAVGLGALRGQLPWPTDGRIVAGFGRQVHPRFGTETFRRGIDIEAEEGATIRAVYAGTVLYRGWLKGYGNLIILDHGSGYYTLYAHASELLVGEGEGVRAGQAIARVGETGSLEGPRLYFEVRYEGRPEDPAGWLRRRS
jgi:septal ring factor EnvC (AmiA/AmiB activator)